LVLLHGLLLDPAAGGVFAWTGCYILCGPRGGTPQNEEKIKIKIKGEKRRKSTRKESKKTGKKTAKLPLLSIPSTAAVSGTV